MDATLSGVRLATLHAEPLRHAGLRGTHTPGAVGGIRKGVFDGAAFPAADPGAAGRVVPVAAVAGQAAADPDYAAERSPRAVGKELHVGVQRVVKGGPPPAVAVNRFLPVSRGVDHVGGLLPVADFGCVSRL